MAYLRGFGAYLPERVVANAEVAALVSVEPQWIVEVSGIQERRYAADGETIASMAKSAAAKALENAGVAANEIGMILFSSGTAERRFPGPAATLGVELGLPGVPAIDLPIASAGALFGIALANQLATDYGNVLVVASEMMSRAVKLEPGSKDTAILFGDGAGATVVSRDSGFARITDSAISTDGSQSEALQLPLVGQLLMDGRTVIMHVTRKLPRIINEILQRNQIAAADVGMFLLHQANQNLLARVAKSLGVGEDRIFSNVGRYGNTSSASMLIAASEWWQSVSGALESPIVFSAFGAGLNWGAILAVPA